MIRDLTYWGFEQLAHPLNGIISTQFRPVDCTTKQPLQFNPGFINQTIYGERVETGWGWFPYKHNTVTFWSEVCPFRHLEVELMFRVLHTNFWQVSYLSCCFLMDWAGLLKPPGLMG